MATSRRIDHGPQDEALAIECVLLDEPQRLTGAQFETNSSFDR